MGHYAQGSQSRHHRRRARHAAVPRVGGDPFLLLLGDHVYVSDTKDRCARQLTRIFEEFGCAAVTGVQPTL
ncbi:MAG: hypothetical protein ACAI43_16485, partial [Phycisphaerae bacterium]